MFSQFVESHFYYSYITLVSSKWQFLTSIEHVGWFNKYVNQVPIERINNNGRIANDYRSLSTFFVCNRTKKTHVTSWINFNFGVNYAFNALTEQALKYLFTTNDYSMSKDSASKIVNFWVHTFSWSFTARLLAQATVTNTMTGYAEEKHWGIWL